MFGGVAALAAPGSAIRARYRHGRMFFAFSTGCSYAAGLPSSWRPWIPALRRNRVACVLPSVADLEGLRGFVSFVQLTAVGDRQPLSAARSARM